MRRIYIPNSKLTLMGEETESEKLVKLAQFSTKPYFVDYFEDFTEDWIDIKNEGEDAVRLH